MKGLSLFTLCSPGRFACLGAKGARKMEIKRGSKGDGDGDGRGQGGER